MSCGIFGGQSGTGEGFLRVLRFLPPILIPPDVPYSYIIRGWYNGTTSGRCTKWTRYHYTPRNKQVLGRTNRLLSFDTTRTE
jgi:hypothetical protein